MAAPWRNGFSHFSFGCKFYKQSGCKGWSPTSTPIKHKTHHLEPQNIRESILDFTARFGEINPDMPYLCDGVCRGPKGLFLPLFPLFGGRQWKKSLNRRFFAKKQVNFWGSYLLSRKLLIVNRYLIVRRENLGRFQVILNSLKSPILLLF